MEEENYDYSKLLGLMREKGVTQQDVANNIPLNLATLSGRLNNKSEFKQSEMLNICEFLDINLSEIHNYFFAH